MATSISSSRNGRKQVLATKSTIQKSRKKALVKKDADLHALDQAMQARLGVLLASNSLAEDLKNAFNVEKSLAQVKGQDEDDFIYLHVEPLLDQAADLLDRVVRERTYYDEQKAKQCLLIIEVQQQRALDAIDDEEIAKGKFDVAAKEAVAQSLANLERISSHQDQQANTDFLLKNIWDDDHIAVYVKKRMIAGRARGFPAYTFSEDDAKKTPIFFGKNYLDMGNQDVKEVFATSEQTFSNAEYTTQVRTLQNESRTSQEIQNAGSELAVGLKARGDWEQANSGFMNDRSQVRKLYARAKWKSAIDPRGVLNYEKYLTGLSARMSYDFSEAKARLNVASRGLQALYGYSAPFPQDGDPINIVDGYLLWVRHAIQKMVRFQRKEQAAVITLSVRKLLGETKWKAGLLKAEWSFALDDTQEVFKNLFHVRLRGISAAVVTKSVNNSIWKLEASAPTQSRCRHLDGSVHPLDQRELKPCILGRVATRDTIKVPDICGVSLLYNASPFGKWHLRVIDSSAISKPDVNESKAESLEDIQLDVQVNFRRR